MGSWGYPHHHHQPIRLWSRRSWHRWPWSRHSRTRRNRRAGRTRRADLGFVRKSLNIQNRTKILFKMEDPINPLEFLIFCCLLGVFFQGCLLSCGVSEYFSHLDGWKHFGNQVQFHHVVRGSNFCQFPRWPLFFLMAASSTVDGPFNWHLEFASLFLAIDSWQRLHLVQHFSE